MDYSSPAPSLQQPREVAQNSLSQSSATFISASPIPESPLLISIPLQSEYQLLSSTRLPPHHRHPTFLVNGESSTERSR